jgi:hypothetical protein
MTDPWVCIDCGARQADQGRCAACSHDDTLDARDERVRELMRDVDRRLADRRDARFRWIGVVGGMAIVFGLWLVPGYWGLRGYAYPGLPVFADQWALMALIGFGIGKLLHKLVGKPRFPYLQDDLTIR